MLLIDLKRWKSSSESNCLHMCWASHVKPFISLREWQRISTIRECIKHKQSDILASKTQKYIIFQRKLYSIVFWTVDLHPFVSCNLAKQNAIRFFSFNLFIRIFTQFFCSAPSEINFDLHFTLTFFPKFISKFLCSPLFSLNAVPLPLLTTNEYWPTKRIFTQECGCIECTRWRKWEGIKNCEDTEPNTRPPGGALINYVARCRSASKYNILYNNKILPNENHVRFLLKCVIELQV